MMKSMYDISSDRSYVLYTNNMKQTCITHLTCMSSSNLSVRTIHLWNNSTDIYENMY